MKKLAIKGTLWTIAGYGGSQVLRLGSNIILTRLLVPDLFGLMALINTFILGLQMFSDVGITPSIIRSPRGEDPTFINTAWTLQVIRGFGLWVVCCVMSWPVSQFYQRPELLWLLPLVGLTTVIHGFDSTSLATLNRKMELAKITLLQFSVQITALTVTIVWAYFHRSIWALVAGSLVSNSMKMFVSHRLDPEVSNRFVWDQDSLKELLSFGRWIFLTTVMAFGSTQADKLMLGRLFPLEILGVYIIAVTFADIPRKAFRQVSQKVMMPVFSKYIDLPRKVLRNKISKKRWLLLVALAIMISVLFCGGDYIISTLYDERYKDAAWMLPLLSLGLWPMILAISIDKSLYALGKPIYPALGNCLKLVYMLIGIPFAFTSMGIIGVIFVIVLNDIPYYLAVNYGLWKEKLFDISCDIKATGLLIALIITGTGIRLTLGLGSSIDQLPIDLSQLVN